MFQPTAAASPTAVSEDRRVDGWVDGGVGPALPSGPSPSSPRSRKTGPCDFCRLGKKRLTPLICGAPAIETRSTRSLSPASGKKLEWIDVSLNAGILVEGSSRQQVLRGVERRADRQDSLHQSGQRKAKAESSSSSESPAWEHGSWAVTFIPRWSRFGLNSKLGGPHWGGIRFGRWRRSRRTSFVAPKSPHAATALLLLTPHFGPKSTSRATLCNQLESLFKTLGCTGSAVRSRQDLRGPPAHGPPSAPGSIKRSFQSYVTSWPWAYEQRSRAWRC